MSPWMNPQVNPVGNYLMWSEAMKANGYTNVEKYLGPQPKPQLGQGDDIEEEWQKFLQGDTIDEPPEGKGPAAINHLQGHMQQRETMYSDLPEEYRHNFDNHIRATEENVMKFRYEMQQEQMVNKLVQERMQEVMATNPGAVMNPQGQPQQPQQEQQQPPAQRGGEQNVQ